MDIIDIHPHIISDDEQRYPPAPLFGKRSNWSQERPNTVESLIGAMDAAGSDIEAPELRAIILSEHSGTANGEMAATRCLSNNINLSRFYIHREHVLGGCTNDRIPGRDSDRVNHRLARNALTEFLGPMITAMASSA